VEDVGVVGEDERPEEGGDRPGAQRKGEGAAREGIGEAHAASSERRGGPVTRPPSRSARLRGYLEPWQATQKSPAYETIAERFG
jgi:hypothetical protein